MAKRLEAIPVLQVPVGYMTCVACSDYKKKPGQMWLGYSSYGRGDDFIDCPVCKGTGQVERFKYIDARTGQEIDYEKPGQRYVGADQQVTNTGSNIIITG